MAKEHILVIDDEEDISELIRFNLAREGYSVSVAHSGEDGLSLAQSKLAQGKQPNLVLLDLMLPGMDGFDVCKALKSDPILKTIAIIMLTAKGEDADVVTGLELGADDYVIKPFSPRVLLARVKNVLRHKRPETQKQESLLDFDGLQIDPARCQVLTDGEMLDLTATEFKLLHLLAKSPGMVFTRAKIVDLVHGTDYPVTDRSVDVQIVGLRKKLARHSHLLETVRGIGYKFKESFD